MSVTPSMIAVALGVTAPVPGSITDQQWTLWIADAEMLIEARRVQLAAPAIDQAKIDYVVREAVVSHVQHPEDSTQVTVSVDDGSTSKSYKSGSGRVSILDAWWLLLGLTEPGGAFSIDTLSAYSRHLPWCALTFGALYCSCGVDIAGYPIFELN